MKPLRLPALFAWVLLPLAADAAPPAVEARVNGQPIYATEVERVLAPLTKGRQVEPRALQVLRRQTLAQLIDRRLVLEYLARRKLGASQQDVDLAWERLTKGLAEKNLTLDDHLRRTGLDETSLRRALAWQLGWRRYLERHLTDENLEKHFQRHRRDFDGTQIHAAHILLRVQVRDDPRALAAAIQRAEGIRREIDAGKLTFAEAAGKYSQAPTSKRGGDIGLIARHEPMPEPFSRAAFALDKDHVSQPVVTPFGVHLIRCLQVEPGKKKWRQVRGELEKATAQYLFRWIADRERGGATIEIMKNEETRMKNQ
jgi:parvulin-like peptidyl-prolyl isomerase